MSMTLSHPSRRPRDNDRQNDRPLAQITRLQFQRWLKRRPAAAKRTALPRLLADFGGGISPSAAYRAAVSIGVRGTRLNTTQYEDFWSAIDWQLPDSTLSKVWGVFRGNLRARRVRVGAGDPRFDARRDKALTAFKEAVEHERVRASKFTGQRPS